MYCSNCGNKLEENAKFCSNCGKSTIKNIKKYGMKYFEFFYKYYLKFIIIIGIITLFVSSSYYTQGIEMENAILLILHLVMTIVLYIWIPVKLNEELPKKTKVSYVCLIIFLIIDYLWRVLNTSFSSIYNNGDALLTILIAMSIYSIWYIPNLIYFLNRKRLFKN